MMPSAKTIVVVDDNAALANSYQAILAGEGYRCLAVGGGLRALERLEHMEVPDLLLLDCWMLEITVAEFLRELRCRRPDLCERCPIIGFSDCANDSPMPSGIKGELRRIVEKPSGMDELIQVVREAVG